MKKILEKALDDFKIDKANWVLTKFGDVAIQQKQKVDRENTELTRYVQGGHMNSEDLHLRSWGDLQDEYLGPAFIRRFDEGDILYGSRRTYLRKVVIAPFSGITSNTTFVMKANEEKINKRLLPFIMMSEGFTENSIKNSKGSVNPYINWKDIAKYEFLLPPKDQQAQLAKLLWAMDEVIEREKEVLESLNQAYLSNRKYFIEKGLSQLESSKKIKFGLICSNWKTVNLNDVCDLISGNAFKSSDFNNHGEFQVLRIGNITDLGFDTSKSPVFINDVKSKETKYFIPKGAIVMSLTGTNGRRDYGFPSLMNDHNKYLLNQRLVMLIVKSNKILPEFLYLISKMEFFQAKFFLNATGTANQANVSISDVSNIEIPLPSLEVQSKISDKMGYFGNSYSKLDSKLTCSISLQKSLINQIFG